MHDASSPPGAPPAFTKRECRRCGALFLESENHPRACRYHRDGYMEGSASDHVPHHWGCCGQSRFDSVGCATDAHVARGASSEEFPPVTIHRISPERQHLGTFQQDVIYFGTSSQHEVRVSDGSTSFGFAYGKLFWEGGRLYFETYSHGTKCVRGATSMYQPPAEHAPSSAWKEVLSGAQFSVEDAGVFELLCEALPAVPAPPPRPEAPAPKPAPAPTPAVNPPHAAPPGPLIEANFPVPEDNAYFSVLHQVLLDGGVTEFKVKGDGWYTESQLSPDLAAFAKEFSINATFYFPPLRGGHLVEIHQEGFTLKSREPEWLQLQVQRWASRRKASEVTFACLSSFLSSRSARELLDAALRWVFAGAATRPRVVFAASWYVDRSDRHPQEVYEQTYSAAHFTSEPGDDVALPVGLRAMLAGSIDWTARHQTVQISLRWNQEERKVNLTDKTLGLRSSELEQLLEALRSWSAAG